MNRSEMKLEAAGPRRWPLTALTRALAGCLGVLGLSACVAPAQREPMRVAPNYRVEHAGPGLAQGYAALARRYEGEGRGAEALQAWRKAVLAAPGDADLQNALGKAEARQGESDAAVAAFQRAAALAPGQAALLNNLGYALMLAGRNEEARQSLQQALALQPGHARAQANLERLGSGGVVTPAGAAQGPAVTGDSAPAPLTAAETRPPGLSPSAPPAAGIVPDGRPANTAVMAATADAAVGAAVSVRGAEGPDRLSAEAAIARPEIVKAQTAMVEIANGNGVNGMAACMADALRERGALGSARLRNALPYDTPRTVVRYRAGHAEAAQTLASQLPGGVQAVAGTDRSDSLDLRIVLGHDLRAGELCMRRS